MSFYTFFFILTLKAQPTIMHLHNSIRDLKKCLLGKTITCPLNIMCQASPISTD